MTITSKIPETLLPVVNPHELMVFGPHPLLLILLTIKTDGRFPQTGHLSIPLPPISDYKDPFVIHQSVTPLRNYFNKFFSVITYLTFDCRQQNFFFNFSVTGQKTLTRSKVSSWGSTFSTNQRVLFSD